MIYTNDKYNTFLIFLVRLILKIKRLYKHCSIFHYMLNDKIDNENQLLIQYYFMTNIRFYVAV